MAGQWQMEREPPVPTWKEIAEFVKLPGEIIALTLFNGGMRMITTGQFLDICVDEARRQEGTDEGGE